MRRFYILAVGLCLTFCKSDLNTKTKTLDFKAFKLSVPADWNKFEIKGIDSYVGGLTNMVDTLTFDYGQYSYDLKSEDPATQLFALDTINGKFATLTKPVNNGGLVGLYISNVKNDNHFNLISRNTRNVQGVIDILKSVVFPDGDTTSNSRVYDFKTKEISPTAGNYLKRNCVVCHSIYDERIFTGPSLANYPRNKFIDWFVSDTATQSQLATNKGWHQRTFKLEGLELKILTEYLTKAE